METVLSVVGKIASERSEDSAYCSEKISNDIEDVSNCMTTIKDRVLEFIKHLETNQYQFEKQTGLSNGFVNNIGRTISEKSLKKIYSKYPDLSPGWLENGVGYMLKSQKEGERTRVGIGGNTEHSKEGRIANPQLSYLEQRRQQKSSHSLPTAPLIPAKAQAGYVRAIDQERYMDTLEQYALPPGVDPRGNTWAYWEIEGDSMETAFYEGDVILTSLINPLDWQDIKNFYVYVIVTHDRVLIKRVYPKTTTEWVLISENEDQYPQILLPVDQVKELWVFRRRIEAKAPPTKTFEIKV